MSMPEISAPSPTRAWYRLRLPGDLERQYMAQAHVGNGTYIQSWLLVFILFNVLSLKTDLDLFGEEALAVPLFLTLGVFVPATLLAIVSLRGTPSANRQAAAVIVTALLDMAIVLNSARIVPAPHSDTYLILAVIVPLVVGMIAPLSFRQTILFCGLSFTLYVGFVLGVTTNHPSSSGVQFLIASLILVPLKLAYTREQALKQRFLLNLSKNQQAMELAAANARLTILSQTDPLTGIPNRRSFDGRLQAAWTEAKAAKAWIAVASIDIDFFKRLNDTAGHLAGDRCLIAVAEALRAPVEAQGGLVARYGGEEFIAFVPGTMPEQLPDLGERLRAAVAALEIPHPDLAGGCCVTVSIGVTAAQGEMAADIDDLLRAADIALYRAKGAGRNRVESADVDVRPAPEAAPRRIVA